jgi:hypothetical protein
LPVETLAVEAGTALFNRLDQLREERPNPETIIKAEGRRLAIP